MSSSKTPKTPSRQRSKSLRAPLTPSLLAGMNSLSIAAGSPSKAADYTNPFVSRPTSPFKRSNTNKDMTAELKRQGSMGVLRKGTIEASMELRGDYVPSPIKPRSKSLTVSKRETVRDRFINDRDDMNPLATLINHNIQSASPGHTARLAEATGVPYGQRILRFTQPPPAPEPDKTMALQRELVKPLHARPGAVTTSTGGQINKTRKIATTPERVLDAPGMVDDYYLNLVAFSSLNVVAVALSETTYMWNAKTGDVVQLGSCPEGTYVSSVDWSADGSFLGVGLGTGAVELWDTETHTRLRTMSGHQGQVAVLSWNGHVLSSGCGDGSIWHHDVRVARHKVQELLGHTGEVCGMKWRPDGELLASGGNDNVVNVWDARIGEVAVQKLADAKMTRRNHTAAVKAIGWAPWDSHILASGGGTSDANIHVWSVTTGARLQTVKTPAQVTSIIWSPHKKELLSTHGYPTNSLMIHAYPSMSVVAEIRDAHDSRVLYSAMAPAGDVVVTGAGDENLKFWRIWEVPPKKEKKHRSNPLTSDSILTLR
ncbi:WD40 repeat-like protein [Exidia glandulosa HHB12029]|uniref:WD40 repeat-like protein n=1 Tax=Exidia glandulosa HHB12029 TaxID=1314781 RepID=A0A165IE47_EXIGL|nr:WD40 repeat-like protein [Exidia glandulosa HHB12029]